jgi:AraC-like DNA-binding protein/mannose-6-phosphate isomerase-like protein (cupin superfamily)
MSGENAKILSYHPDLPAYGVLVESHHHGPNFKTAIHRHSYSTLIYVVSGRGRCITENGDYYLESDSVLMLERNMPHQMIDKPSGAMVVFVVYFADSLPLVEDEMTGLLFEQPLVQVPRHNSRQLRQILRQMLYEQNARPDFYDSAMLQCFSSIMLMLYRLAAAGADKSKVLVRSHDRVLEILNYVQSHYYETFTLSDIASDAGLSCRQFANVCRQLKGQSFVQYLNAIRTQKATELLIKTSMSISAIAFEVGFEEISTFYRAFKKHQGQSPLSLRKENHNYQSDIQ